MSLSDISQIKGHLSYPLSKCIFPIGWVHVIQGDLAGDKKLCKKKILRYKNASFVGQVVCMMHRMCCEAMLGNNGRANIKELPECKTTKNVKIYPLNIFKQRVAYIGCV